MMAFNLPKNISFGDLIEVKTKEKTFIGRLMKRPEIIKGNYLVIKLENGYNIGISYDKIIEIRLIEKYKKKETIERMEFREGLKKIVIASTGGTISSKVDYTTGGVEASIDATTLVNWVKEIKDVANVETKQILMKMSENMRDEDWIKMGKEAYKELKRDDISGIVITHGTDTMHFSTAALSFLFEKLNKPIIFTGAQRSSDRPSSDAYLNLLSSVYMAKEDIGEVLLVMHSSIEDKSCFAHFGTRVRKMHTSRRDAFKSFGKPLAEIFRDGKIRYFCEPRKDDEIRFFDRLEKKVGLLYIYPGISKEIIDFFIERNYKGLIIVGTGLGHTPTINGFIEKIKEASEKMIVCICSQCLYGATHPYVYSNLRKLSIIADCIYLKDMLPEVAYVKLKYVLAKTKKEEEVRRLMVTNLKREISFGETNG